MERAVFDVKMSFNLGLEARDGNCQRGRQVQRLTCAKVWKFVWVSRVHKFMCQVLRVLSGGDDPGVAQEAREAQGAGLE